MGIGIKLSILHLLLISFVKNNEQSAITCNIHNQFSIHQTFFEANKSNNCESLCKDIKEFNLDNNFLLSKLMDMTFQLPSFIGVITLLDELIPV